MRQARSVDHPDVAHSARDSDGVLASLVFLTGEIDIATADRVRADLVEAIDAARGGRVVVDLSGVTVMDCRGLAVLVQARTSLGGRLTLSRPSRTVLRLLDLTGLRHAFGVTGPEVAAGGRSA